MNFYLFYNQAKSQGPGHILDTGLSVAVSGLQGSRPHPTSNACWSRDCAVIAGKWGFLMHFRQRESLYELIENLYPINLYRSFTKAMEPQE